MTMFVTFARSALDAPRLGMVLEERLVVDLGSLRDAPFDNSSMLGLIDGGERALAWVRAHAGEAAGSLPLNDLHLFAPIPRPRKNVFCVGWNYLAHFEEGEKIRTTAMELPEHPTFFTKASTSVTGPRDCIKIGRGITQRLDWEAELAVVIGKAGRDIPLAHAMEHIWGYTVLNDISARDLQREHGNQWFKGKSLDGSCPMGPGLVTADAIDARDLAISCRVNGEIKQAARTTQMYFDVAQIIAELSWGLTLEPGDIIATGTPQGVGHARTPPQFLAHGDVLETEISGIGSMRNAIAQD